MRKTDGMVKRLDVIPPESHVVIPDKIQRVLSKPEVQNEIVKFLESPALAKELKRVAKEGLKACRSISAVINMEANEKTMDFVDVPDHRVRHLYWHDLMEAANYLKVKGGGPGVSIVNIIYGHRAKPANITVRK